MSVKSLYLLILTLFVCVDVLSQQTFRNPKLYEVEKEGKRLISELRYKDAIDIFNTSKSVVYNALPNELKIFNDYIKNSADLETCIIDAESLEKGNDVKKIINKFLDCNEIFPATRIKSIDSKILKHATNASKTIESRNLIIKAFDLLNEGDDLLEQENPQAAIDKYNQVKNLQNVPDYILERAKKKTDRISNKPHESKAIGTSQSDKKPEEPVNLTPSDVPLPQPKNWNVNIYVGAFKGSPNIANSNESLTTRIPLANSEIGIDYTSKVDSIKSPNVFWSAGLGYMQYSFASVDNNQKDIESFKLNYLKLKGAVKVFITKKGTFQPFIKLEPFVLIPIKTEYHNYYNENIDPATTIARVATIGGTLSIGGEINTKYLRVGIEPFMMMCGNFLKSKPGIEGLQNPSQLKSSLLGYGLKIYIGLGNSQQ